MQKIATSALLVLGIFGTAFAQTPSQNRPAPASKMQNCQQMMAKMEASKADMKAMNDQLRQKLQQMQTAKGDAKLDATAEVVNQLATQHLKMHEMMQTMNDQKMNHMMGHMGDRAAMEQCPMMKGMGSAAKGESPSSSPHQH